MEPQTSIPPAANILGTIGTVCWSIQLCPQIWRNYKTKSTEGLPPAMMLLWSASGVPFGIYAIAQRFNVPLIVQPQCFCVLCGITWAQCLYYGRKWKASSATLILLGLFALFLALQIGLVYAIREPYARGIYWPVTTIGIISFVMIMGGYAPIFFELTVRRGRLVGVDFTFLAIDWMGAFLSLMSLLVQGKFDVLFGTMYALCCTIEITMVISHLIWLFRTRAIRARAKGCSLTFDEFEEAIAWQGKGTDLVAKLRGLFPGSSQAAESNRDGGGKGDDRLKTANSEAMTM